MFLEKPHWLLKRARCKVYREKLAKVVEYQLA